MQLTEHCSSIFLAGLGGGIDAVVLSETSRYTSLTQRTSAMALLVGSRLLGYMIGQHCVCMCVCVCLYVCVCMFMCVCGGSFVYV